MKDRILVFIPMYNCEKQIVRVIDQLIKDDIRQFIDEAIIINNRSLDNGENVVINKLKQIDTDLKIKLLRNNENYGLGGSHKVAFKYAIDNNFDYIIVLHGDDQGSIKDLIPLIRSEKHKNYDCILGSRFMKESKIKGYSKIRIWGNHIFNSLFSIVVRKKIYDLGSGLNMYKLDTLKKDYYSKFPDTLYFNDCMILAYCYYKQNILFYPISWREEDQVSNNKLIKFSISLLKMLFAYIKNKKKYIESEMRTKIINSYEAETIYEIN